MGVSVADGDQLGFLGLDLVYSAGQASTLLATEDSPEMAEEYHDGLAAGDNGIEIDDLVVEVLDGYQVMPGREGVDLP